MVLWWGLTLYERMNLLSLARCNGRSTVDFSLLSNANAHFARGHLRAGI